MTYLFTHWKSTVNGILAFLITTGVVLLATGNALLSPKVTTYLTIGLALARAYVGLISKDASALTATDIATQTAAAAPKAK